MPITPLNVSLALPPVNDGPLSALVVSVKVWPPAEEPAVVAFETAVPTDAVALVRLAGVSLTVASQVRALAAAALPE